MNRLGQKIFYSIIFTVLAVSTLAQPHKIAPFNDHETVCFVGNSITHSGEFHHNIFLYYLTHFPEKRIQFYNNGISGDVTAGILKRMDDDILFHKPTTVIIMIGMNDVQRSLYTTSLNPKGDTLQRRQQALVTYKKNLDSIVRLFIHKKIRVILQKPSIYDQTAVQPRPNNLGVNDALKLCADYMQVLANQYQLDIVDYWTIMTDINQRIQKSDSAATIISSDRIHPGPLGHQVMSYQFIHSTNVSPYVTRLVVGTNRKTSNKYCYKSVILNLTKKKNAVLFSAREDAMPYPLNIKAMTALNLVPISDSINNQLLQVSFLKPGKYELRIENIVIGTFTADQFKKGINLINYSNTPQYVRALALRKFLDENYFPLEANWRAIKLFDYRYLAGFASKNDTAAVRKYVYEKNPSTIESIKTSVNKYVNLKSQQHLILNQLKELNDEAHQMAVSRVYHYQIITVH